MQDQPRSETQDRDRSTVTIMLTDRPNSPPKSWSSTSARRVAPTPARTDRAHALRDRTPSPRLGRRSSPKPRVSPTELFLHRDAALLRARGHHPVHERDERRADNHDHREQRVEGQQHDRRDHDGENWKMPSRMVPEIPLSTVLRRRTGATGRLPPVGDRTSRPRGTGGGRTSRAEIAHDRAADVRREVRTPQSGEQRDHESNSKHGEDLDDLCEVAVWDRRVEQPPERERERRVNARPNSM